VQPNESGSRQEQSFAAEKIVGRALTRRQRAPLLTTGFPEFLHVPCEDCAPRGIREVGKVGAERFRAMRNDFPMQSFVGHRIVNLKRSKGQR
jgi:hypothetical protein